MATEAASGSDGNRQGVDGNGQGVETAITYHRLEEVEKCDSLKEIYILEEKEVLLEQAGANSSESFEDVGHSSDAREMLKRYYIGDVHPDDLKPESGSKDPSRDATCKSAIVLGFLYHYYTSESKSS
ncbi:unnamed protein product [Nyctereutes procyonoides]|uniref:(raccoon dog) hypothetical protein n=1 Tax=Nyctereutes procyonoides TaxID=34880 RepID=A0A811YPX5_NYCPR|nr:unnamed protein product [Nyctereutes procyonoides]